MGEFNGRNWDRVILYGGIAAIVGGMFLCVLYLGVFAPANGLIARDHVSDRMTRQLIELGIVSNPDEIEYVYSDAFLNLDEGVGVLSDTGVAYYAKLQKRDKNPGVGSLKRIPNDELHVVYCGTARGLDADDILYSDGDDPAVRVTGVDGAEITFLPKTKAISDSICALLSGRLARTRQERALAARGRITPEMLSRIDQLTRRGTFYTTMAYGDTPAGFVQHRIDPVTLHDGEKGYRYREQYVFVSDLEDHSRNTVSWLETDYDRRELRLRTSTMRVIDYINQMRIEVSLIHVRDDTYAFSTIKHPIKRESSESDFEDDEYRDTLDLKDEFLFNQFEEFYFPSLFFSDDLKRGRRIYSTKVSLDWRRFPYYDDDPVLSRLTSDTDGRLHLWLKRAERWECGIVVNPDGVVETWHFPPSGFLAVRVSRDRIDPRYVAMLKDAFPRDAF